MTTRKVRQIFNTVGKLRGHLYFSVGRGLPKQQPIELIWFTHHGRIQGYAKVREIIRYDGYNLPKLMRLDGGPSEWQFRPMTFVAVCWPDFTWLRGAPVYHEGFRGWRYFDFAAYSKTVDAKFRLER